MAKPLRSLYFSFPVNYVSYYLVLTLQMATIRHFLDSFVKFVLPYLLWFRICANTMHYQEQVNLLLLFTFDFIYRFQVFFAIFGDKFFLLFFLMSGLNLSTSLIALIIIVMKCKLFSIANWGIFLIMVVWIESGKFIIVGGHVLYRFWFSQ